MWPPVKTSLTTLPYSSHPFLGTLASRDFQEKILFWFSSYLNSPPSLRSRLLCVPKLCPRTKSSFHPSLLPLPSALVSWLWIPSPSWYLPNTGPQAPSLWLPFWHLEYLSNSILKRNWPPPQSLLISRGSTSISPVAQGDIRQSPLVLLSLPHLHSPVSSMTPTPNISQISRHLRPNPRPLSPGVLVSLLPLLSLQFFPGSQRNCLKV